MSQIVDATEQPDSNWISQPGLIRVFTGTGSNYTAYKLYSSDNMRPDNFNPGTAVAPTDVPDDWKTRPSEYVDLNAPVRNGLSSIYPIASPDLTLGTKGFSFPSSGNLGISMPVRWIYVFQDGTFGLPSAATKVNPIVGRIAFWADDETSKININTAAGDEWAPSGDIPGPFMDTPRFRSSWDENSLAQSQPRQGEFQRYPGHPATTFLSAVFPALTRDQLAAINPRINGGGSKGGTVNNSNLSILEPKSDRLYATIDELFFSQPSTSATLRTAGVLPQSQINNSQFFLTAQSRAPEVNMYNKPRITIWPIAAQHSDTSGTTSIYGDRTIFDKAIAFASTISKKPYYFVRNDSANPIDDFTKFRRNQELYQYLQYLTSENPPGYQNNFLAKYGADRDQILTEIFDYIRCTNLSDSSLAPNKRFTVSPSADGTKIQESPPGTGQVVPIEISTGSGVTRGFGRIPTLFSPSLIFYATKYTPNSINDPQNWGVTKGIQALFLIPSFTVSQGVMRLLPNIVYEVEGLDNLMLDGQPLGFPHIGRVSYNAVSPYDEYGWGGIEGAANPFWINGGTPKALGTSFPDQYPFFSNILPVNKPVNPCYPPFTNTGNFGSYTSLTSNGPITVRIYAPDRSRNIPPDPIQTLKFEFPGTPSIPTPRPYLQYNPSPSAPKDYFQTWNSGDRAFKTSNFFTYKLDKDTSYDENDSTRSVSQINGDVRLTAAIKNVNKSAFTPDKNYNIQTLNAHSFRAGNQSAGRGSWGQLVKDAGYAYAWWGSTYFPAVPSFINGAYLRGLNDVLLPGDWDNGMGEVSDGPYINKPDEGDYGPTAYYSYDAVPVKASLFSPNRQVPSPVIFGSLSTGVKASEEAYNQNKPDSARPWQTLLFCPNPPAGNQHPGKADPPDHLLLDLFTMPVVQPFAISEPFSTMGKINLNSQLVPFTYIERTTGIHAVLRSTRISAVATTEAYRYKLSGSAPANYRLRINTDETLKGFKKRYDENKPFRTASEICDMFLVPETAPPGGSIPTISNIETWWQDYGLTGDNSREKPYADIYSRLTTKSNSFKIHVRAQSLKKISGNDPAKWVEEQDLVEGEWRGSILIERYLNPTLASYDETQPLTGYKFRTLSVKRFDP